MLFWTFKSNYSHYQNQSYITIDLFKINLEPSYLGFESDSKRHSAVKFSTNGVIGKTAVRLYSCLCQLTATDQVLSNNYVHH